MKCTECGSTMTKKIGDHPYAESGLPHVILRNVAEYRCPKDGTEFVELERVAQLHRLIAEILSDKPARLMPGEVRFLRDHMALNNRQFAQLLGVTESQSSRWVSATNPEQMNLAAEYFLRALATMGPITLVTDDAAVTQIGKMEGGKFVELVAHGFGKLPPRDAPTQALATAIRRTSSSDWKAETQLATV